MTAAPDSPLGDDSTQTQRHSGVGGGTIGPYRLLERLGEGGMGEVWLAEQTRPVRRQVALKVIKAGMDTAQVVARFEAERQALAVMDHPGIAKVFDASATDQGRPYSRWNTSGASRSLATATGTVLPRASGSTSSCTSAKPCNTLTEGNNPSRPETLEHPRYPPRRPPCGERDRLRHREGNHTAVDRAHALYIASRVRRDAGNVGPEQAETAGGLDTRTDVYALGVVLYELLTVSLPLTARHSRTRVSTRSDGRSESDPPRPSTRVRQMGNASTESAGNRRTEPGRLASLLQGDLDWIAMKALEKDRARRYGSVSDLAADVGRHKTQSLSSRGRPALRIGRGNSCSGIVWRGCRRGGSGPGACFWSRDGAPGSAYRARTGPCEL